MILQLQYVGPPAILEAVRESDRGTVILSPDELSNWLGELAAAGDSEQGWCTYVIDLQGRLVLAPRRTEHVACAGAFPVLAAGELQLDLRSCTIIEITNNSTGYCPPENCWSAVASALDHASLAHPGSFTFTASFRRCPSCLERNLVKDDWFYCAMCESELPADWNFLPEQDAR